MNGMLVVLGGMLGAPARYLLDRAVATRFGSRLPWGTLTVNIVGSAVLGALIGAGVDGSWLAVAGTGFCGALTTYSTFGYETIQLVTNGAYASAFGNVVLNVTAGLAAVFAAASATQGSWT